MNRVKYLRPAKDVVYGVDFSWLPSWGLCPDWDEKRNQAVVEVARRLPDKAMATLEEKADLFGWFIPHNGNLAGVFLSRRGLLLYLGPKLESVDYDIVVASVAHELAHIVLGHQEVRLGRPQGKYWKNEKQAWALVDRWGFGRETKKHEGFYKRKHDQEVRHGTR